MEVKKEYFIGLLLKDPFTELVETFYKNVDRVLRKEGNNALIPRQVTLIMPFQVEESKQEILRVSSSVAKQPVILPATFESVPLNDGLRSVYLLTYRDLLQKGAVTLQENLTFEIEQAIPGTLNSRVLQVPSLILGAYTTEEKHQLAGHDFFYKSPSVCEVVAMVILKKTGEMWAEIGRMNY
jgi:hypothetical protein